MTSTVLAFISFPLLAWLFGVRPAWSSWCLGMAKWGP